MTHIEGIRRRGIKNIQNYITPGFMTPMNILEEFTNFYHLPCGCSSLFAGSDG